MVIDLELYRREVSVAQRPHVQLSALDIAPDHGVKTLLFLHGFGGEARQWRYQLQHFAAAQRVVALDLRGHGQADKPNGRYTMDEILSDIATAVQQLQIAGPMILVGHSFGGALATMYTLAHPTQIEHLVLIATPGRFKLNPFSRLMLSLPPTLLRPLERFTRSWLHAPLAVLQRWHEQMLAPWDGWQHFPQLTPPTTVIRGHLDFLFERPQFAEVAGVIPGAQDVDVGASGHLVMLERRSLVNRTLARIVAGAEVHSWRQEEDIGPATRATLLGARPWLAHYPLNVPYTIAIPNALVQDLFHSAVRRFARQTALQYGEVQLNYGRLDRLSNQFANALHALGLSQGERVIFWLQDSPQFVIAYLGALKAGAVCVLAPPQQEGSDLAGLLRATGAQLVLASYEQSQAIHAACRGTQVQHLVFTHQAEMLNRGRRDDATNQDVSHATTQAVGIHHFSTLLAGQPTSQPDGAGQPGDLAVILYTSGATGAAKGVMLTHRNLVANTLQTRHWLCEAKEGKERFLCALFFAHSYGLTATLNLPLALGATLILAPSRDVLHLLTTIRRHQPTIFPGVPAMFVAINHAPNVRQYGIDSINYCISGSEPLPIEVQEEFEKLTKGRLVEGYGLTEAGPVTHAEPLSGRRKIGSIGLPLPSTEAQIVDLVDGQTPVPTGQIGELAVRGPQVMPGYWQQPDETAAVLRADGWLLTGDVAQADSEGFFRIVARKADMWRPDQPGEWAFPRDVEEVLYEVPQVKEVAVVAVANQPIAFIRVQGIPPPVEQILAYGRRRLPPALAPHRVIFVDEFPRSYNGKIQRKLLVNSLRQLE